MADVHTPVAAVIEHRGDRPRPLVSDGTEEPIQLDTSGGTDNSVMLHVYNFQAGMPGTDTVAADTWAALCRQLCCW